MSDEKNYISVRYYFFVFRRILPFIGYYLVLIAILCHGCSSYMAGTVNVRPKDTEPILAEAEIQDNTDSLSGPQRIELDTTSYSFGKIKPRSKNTAVFHFKNAGGQPLKINDIRKCCGAVVKSDKKELAPGQSSAVTVEYQVGQKPGIFNKKITLFTNDPVNSQIDLAFSGKVMQTLEWTPTQFELSDNENKDCPDITIKSLDGSVFSIKRFVSTGNCLTAEFDPNHEAKEFILKPVVDTTKLGALPVSNGRVKIELSHKDYEAIHLSFDVLHALEVIPRSIFAVNAPIDKPVLRTLKLQDHRLSANEDISSRIESLTSENGSRVEVRGFTEVSKGCEIKLEIWPYKDNVTESHWNDKLLIKMKGGRELSVPIYVFYESQKLSSAAGSS